MHGSVKSMMTKGRLNTNLNSTAQRASRMGSPINLGRSIGSILLFLEFQNGTTQHLVAIAAQNDRPQTTNVTPNI